VEFLAKTIENTRLIAKGFQTSCGTIC